MIKTTMICGWRMKWPTGSVERLELCEQFMALPLEERLNAATQVSITLAYMAGLAAIKLDGVSTAPLPEGLLLMDAGPTCLPNLCGGRNFLISTDFGGAVMLSGALAKSAPEIAFNTFDKVSDLLGALILEWEAELGAAQVPVAGM